MFWTRRVPWFLFVPDTWNISSSNAAVLGLSFSGLVKSSLHSWCLHSAGPQARNGGIGINPTWRQWLIPPWDRCLWLQGPAAYWPAVPEPLQVLQRRRGGGITPLAKGQAALQVPNITHCPTCFWVPGCFRPCWQPSPFVQWMLALTFSHNWLSSLKDTEQNKGRLHYKYTKIGHTPSSGEPFISPATVLPRGSETLQVLHGACPRHTARSSLSPAHGDGPAPAPLWALALSIASCMLRNVPWSSSSSQ